MSDLCDKGNDAADIFLKSALTLRFKATLPDPDGRCHNCEASVPPGARWCDHDCQVDWQKHERAQQQRPVDDE